MLTHSPLVPCTICLPRPPLTHRQRGHAAGSWVLHLVSRLPPVCWAWPSSHVWGEQRMDPFVRQMPFQLRGCSAASCKVFSRGEESRRPGFVPLMSNELKLLPKAAAGGAQPPRPRRSVCDEFQLRPTCSPGATVGLFTVGSVCFFEPHPKSSGLSGSRACCRGWKRL